MYGNDTKVYAAYSGMIELQAYVPYQHHKYTLWKISGCV